MSLTYVKLHDLRFLKTQLFDRVITRCILERVIDLRENCHRRFAFLKMQLFDLIVRYVTEKTIDLREKCHRTSACEIASFAF